MRHAPSLASPGCLTEWRPARSARGRLGGASAGARLAASRDSSRSMRVSGGGGDFGPGALPPFRRVPGLGEPGAEIGPESYMAGRGVRELAREPRADRAQGA
jgi:hypothetical protein